MMLLKNKVYFGCFVFEDEKDFKIGDDVINYEHLMALKSVCPILYAHYSFSFYNQEHDEIGLRISLSNFLDCVTQISKYTRADTILELAINAQTGCVKPYNTLAPIILKPFSEVWDTWKLLDIQKPGVRLRY